MDSCWKRCLVVVDSSSPVCRASRLPSFFTSRIAGLCQAPRLSTASGKKTMPCWLHGAQLLSIFRLWATVRAYPGVWAAWLTSAACRGFTTVTSKAASFPPACRGMKMSAGLPPSPGSRYWPSFVGPRAALTAVLCRVSLRALCLAIRSPCQAQLRA